MIIPKYWQLLASGILSSPKNNLAKTSPDLSWSLLLYFYLDLFSSHFLSPNPKSVQVYLQIFSVVVIHDFPIYYTVVGEKSNSWLTVPPNIIYVREGQ